MKKLLAALLLSVFLTVPAVSAAPLVILKQGVFSSGGTVTAPLPGDFNVSENWLDFSRAGNTSHVDHANTFYQIPDGENSTPIVYLHGYGQTRTGWQTDTENIAAIVAIEPGFAPEVGSDNYKKFVAAKIPMIFYFGDYIENGPDDIKSTAFWKSVLDQCRDFAKHYNDDGGDATVVCLPDEGMTGNSHFMFQEMNNDKIAEHIESWLKSRGL